MNTQQAVIPFGAFLVCALAVYLIFSIPTLALLVALNLLSMYFSGFLFLVFGLLGIPVTGAFSWLLARDGRPEAVPAAFLAACAIPAQNYLFLAGGLIGANPYGPVGGTIGAITLALASRLPAFKLARRLWPRLALIRAPNQP